MNAKADQEGFLVAYPEGTGAVQGFNAGGCCGDALKDNVDDVGYARAILEDVPRVHEVDPRRIFATGMSNGGFMSQRLACELADRIAGIAPVAGVLGLARCAPSRPVPVIEFHGTADAVVPYAGGGWSRFPSVEETVHGWAVRNGCSLRADGGAEDRRVVYEKGDSRCEAFSGCPEGGAVVLCRVEGGGHTWPRGRPVPRLGRTSSDLSATDLMWQFFDGRLR